MTSILAHGVLWFFGWLILSRIPKLDKAGPPLKTVRRVSIIIPARNEAARLPELLKSLREQSIKADEILVIDDHSEDDTARLAHEAGCRVVTSAPLPDGWTGKTWACHQGAREATGDLFLFLDADVALEPSGLERMLLTAESRPGAHSIQPFHRVLTLAEELSAFFNLIQMAASNAFTLRGQATKDKRLFGPVLLIGRDDYFRSGGHQAVKEKLVENFALSRILRSHNIPLFCFSGGGAVHMRMYPGGFQDLKEGWTKSFASGARGTSPPVMFAIAAWITGCFGTARHLVHAVQSGSLPDIGFVGLIYLAFAAQIFWMLKKAGSFRWSTALFYPVPAVFFVYVFVRALILSRIKQAVTWKGRPVNQ